MQYRPEIDGLRAVAVMPVILFHAGFSFFSGGYVGVDVFFVISGYLITSILISEREKGTYTLLGFYERRARRILPALFFVLICTIPFAWRWIPPDPFEDYARSLSYAALFISNIHFLEKSSYFDVGAEMRPLLHTWSLAVEEQYYLLFPLVLWALGHFARAKFLLVFLILSALSLGLAEWGWRNYPSENFYFSPSRLWELLAGSICAALLFGREQMRSQWGAMLGLLLILGSVVFYDESIPFPSVYTVVPVLGTALIILFAGQGTWVARLLSVRGMVGIGLISYSAYLWHQPLLVFARIRSVTEPSLMLTGALALLSLILAYLTWRFIETPFRRRRVFAGRKPLLTASVVGILAFAGFGTWGDQTKGLPFRVENKLQGQQAEWQSQLYRIRRTDACTDGESAGEIGLCGVYEAEAPTGRVAVLGDSHAQSILPAFEGLAQNADVTVLRGIRAACPPILGVYLAQGGAEAVICHNLTQHMANQVITQDIGTVFIASRWSLYASGDYSGAETDFALSLTPEARVETAQDRRDSFEYGLDRTVAFYRDAGIRVVLIRQVPQQWVLPENILLQAVLQGLDDDESRAKFRSSFIERARHDALVAYADEVLTRTAQRHGAETLSLTEEFVVDDAYAWFLDDTVLYRDSDHLSTDGALRLSPRILEAFGPQ